MKLKSRGSPWWKGASTTGSYRAWEGGLSLERSLGGKMMAGEAFTSSTTDYTSFDYF